MTRQQWILIELAYQSAIVLLDDVLSALDVHTARSIANECLAGPLLRGRTVILITHNIALVGPHASNFVTIASDGSISSSDEMTDVVLTHPELVSEIEEEVEVTEKAEGIVDESKSKPADTKSSGKLIAEEERAVGRVSSRSCELLSFEKGSLPCSIWLLYSGAVLWEYGRSSLLGRILAGDYWR